MDRPWGLKRYRIQNKPFTRPPNHAQLAKLHCMKASLKQTHNLYHPSVPNKNVKRLWYTYRKRFIHLWTSPTASKNVHSGPRDTKTDLHVEHHLNVICQVFLPWKSIPFNIFIVMLPLLLHLNIALFVMSAEIEVTLSDL